MAIVDLINWFVTIVSFVLALFLGEASNLGCFLQATPKPHALEELHGSGKITFIPIDNFPHSTLVQFSEFFHKTYQLDVHISEPLHLPPSTFNSSREQYIAEFVLAETKDRLFSSSSSDHIIPIIFTNQDMYIQKYNWRYAFSFRQNGMAVISTARMDSGLLNLWTVSKETQISRLRKMVTKNIGVLYYHLPFSDHCQSAMYGHVGGPQELDLMSDQL